MEEISNSYLSVKINSHGGTLDSIFDKRRGEELLWQGAADSWTGKDVCIFPFVGRLRDGVYEYRGRKYAMPLHGFCADADFKCENDGDVCRLSLVGDENTRKIYPFDFKLTTEYKLVGAMLEVTRRVANIGAETMYFSVGGHPAFNVDCVRKDDVDDTSMNAIVFDGPQRLKNILLEPSGCFVDGKLIGDDFRCALKDMGEKSELNLDKSVMAEYGTLMLTSFGEKSVTLTRSGRPAVKFGFDAPILGLWSDAKRGAYICLEPWYGVPDTIDGTREIARKPYVNALAAGKVFGMRFTCTAL